MTGDAPLLAYPQAFWTRAYLWPRGDRQRIFLADAVIEVGAAMFGPEVWTGAEPNEAMDYEPGEVALALAGGAEIARMFRLKRVVQGDARMPEAVTADDDYASFDDCSDFSYHVAAYRLGQQRLRQVHAAQMVQDRYDRVRAVSDWIGDRGWNEDFKTFGRDADGGQLFELTSAVWGVEPLWDKRVRTCSYRPQVGGDTFLFLEREGLSRCLASLPFAPAPAPAGEAESGLVDPDFVNEAPFSPTGPPAALSPATALKPKADGRKRGRKTNPVWARAFAKAYKHHREMALSASDEAFREWIIAMNQSLGKQASPSQHRTIRKYRENAEAGRFDYYLGK